MVYTGKVTLSTLATLFKLYDIKYNKIVLAFL